MPLTEVIKIFHVKQSLVLVVSLSYDYIMINIKLSYEGVSLVMLTRHSSYSNVILHVGCSYKIIKNGQHMVKMQMSFLVHVYT